MCAEAKAENQGEAEASNVHDGTGWGQIESRTTDRPRAGGLIQ